MESLISISLRMREPIAQTIGMRLIQLCDSHIYTEAFINLIFWFWRFKYDTHSKDVINLVEGNVFITHLIPNGIRRLYTHLYNILTTHGIECLTNWIGKLSKKLVTLFLRMSKFFAYILIGIWMFVTESEILKLCLYLI